MNKNFNHKQLIETLKNIDISEHHSISLILNELNGEELIGTPFYKEDPFHLEPITNDIVMQFKMLDRTLNYETIFRAEQEIGKDWALEYGLLSSKKLEDAFLICLQSIGRDYTDTILKKYKLSDKILKQKITPFIMKHYKTKTYAKYNYSKDVYLSKGYYWDLDNLFKFLKKILNNKKKTFPNEDISVWKHRENQKKLTYEKIKYLN